MSSTSASASTRDPSITTLQESDFEEWYKIFHAYITYYKATIPEEQYPKTFQRLLNPSQSELYGLVMRDPENEIKIIGLAHFFPKQTPWSEHRLMHLNDLFIDPNVRSKGYGRKMIQAVAEKAKEMGCSRVQWVTRHDNHTARKLYDTLATSEFVEYMMKLE